MTALLVAAMAAGWALTTLATLALLRAERREGARERRLILEQLLHACGHTWTPPPAADTTEHEEPAWDHNLIRPSQHLEL